MGTAKRVAFAVALLVFAATWVQPRWPVEQALHSSLTVVGFALAVVAVMVTSLVYEWAEWAVALLLSPEAAEAYNGQQGDLWDAHMDMLLATLGALACWPWRDRGEVRRHG